MESNRKSVTQRYQKNLQTFRSEMTHFQIIFGSKGKEIRKMGKKLEKMDQNKLKARRRKEMIKRRAGINEIKNKQKIEKNK